MFGVTSGQQKVVMATVHQWLQYMYSHFLDTVYGNISHGTIKHMTLLIGYFMDENDKENISVSVKKEFQILTIPFCEKNFVVLLLHRNVTYIKEVRLLVYSVALFFGPISVRNTIFFYM